MAVRRSDFGNFEGKPVSAFMLTNARGSSAEVTDFGARLTRMVVPDRTGALADVVLGFDRLEPYRTTDTYFGATCGRYGNRIAKARFPLGGRIVQVTANEGANHLHGGLRGFDKQVWDASVDEAGNAVSFSLTSPDGHEGFPGRLDVRSTYRLTDDDRLLITMSATTDAPTVLNMVHHSYWNMAGHGSGDVLKQHLKVHADFYTPVDDELLATGEILRVAGTPFDFTAEKPIGRSIDAVSNAGFGRLSVDGGGYDHNWVLDGFGPDLRPAATLWDPASGRGLSLSTSEPGVQIYAGGYLSAEVIGKGGQPYCKYAGVTFETQKFPGSPNVPHFPSAEVHPGEDYLHRMEVRFFTR